MVVIVGELLNVVPNYILRTNSLLTRGTCFQLPNKMYDL